MEENGRSNRQIPRAPSRPPRSMREIRASDTSNSIITSDKPGKGFVQIGGSKRTQGKVIYVKHEVYYDTKFDSSLAKCARHATCHCLGQKSEFTTEYIRVRHWRGCSKRTDSMDIDSVEDIQLRETCGLCLCLCGRGDIRIYGQDESQKDEYFTCYNVENAGNVFLKVTELVHKLNDLKYGMGRPDDPTVPQIMYNSQEDGFGIKCCRTTLCGCLRPTTIITKSGVTSSQWHLCIPERITKRLDFDSVQDLSMHQNCADLCCGTGSIRVYGSDKDQTDEYFDVTWVPNCKLVFKRMDKYRTILTNRNRVNFDAEGRPGL